jgi:hypothetical protein
MKAITDYKDGWLTIREAAPMSDTPEMQITWWPIKQESREFLDNMEVIGKDARYTGDGCYSVRIGADQNLPVRMPEGGQTRSLAIAYEPIPAPKVRKGTEIRFRNGQWQKYSKTQGWVAA